MHELGIRDADAKTQNDAADRGKRCRDHECREPELAHAHAKTLRLLCIVAQRHEVQPERGVHNPPHQQTRQHERYQTVIVERAGEKFEFVVLCELQAEDVQARTRMPLSPPVT